MNRKIKSAIVVINHWPIWRRRVRVDGFVCHSCSFDRLLYLWLHKLGVSGTSELNLLRRLVKPGDTVLDIGANVALYTIELSAFTGPGGKVFAFEPVPHLYECAHKTVVANGAENVTTYRMALGQDTGSVIMEGRTFNSGDYRVRASGTGGEGIEVDVRRGDDVLESVASVQVIKIDVQGYEVPALRGLSRLIDRSPDLRIVFEYWPEGMRRAGTEPVDLLAFLRKRGMKLHVFDASGELTEIDWADVDRHCIQRPWGRCGNFVATR